MTSEKLQSDSQTLHRFIQLHCDKKHHDVPKKKGVLAVHFKEKCICELPYDICEECEILLLYAYDRLQNCPRNPKPSCRKCPNPCYEKSMWKKMSKVMSFSGMQLGLTKVRKLFFK
ncbi:MAG: nitrous oxide-stimulated promoter family protein [Epsilonproteobacteria bacterium]|nr:nitrous oxide-stimulated promoter family protein [Campylobacterota bacterium]